MSISVCNLGLLLTGFTLTACLNTGPPLKSKMTLPRPLGKALPRPQVNALEKKTPEAVFQALQVQIDYYKAVVDVERLISEKLK